MIRLETTSRLPSEYQEVEYIQSSGTQYIDSAVKGSSNLRVEMKAQMTANSSITPFLFGARDSGTVASFCMFFYTTGGNAWYCDYQTSANRYKFDSSVVTETGILEVDANKNVWTVNGITKNFSAVSFQSSHNLYLFAINNGGTVADYMPGKIFYCRLYDSDILVRDFAPCYRKSDGVAGLYDLINGVFYTNAGSGAFTVGANSNNFGTTVLVITPGGTIPKKWALRRRTMMSGNAPFTFEYTGNYVDNRDANGIGTVRFTSSGTLTVLSGKVTVSVYILAGGGGAKKKVDSSDSNDVDYCTGGGGGYQTVEVTLTKGVYEIVVGSGGAPLTGGLSYESAGKGGDSSAFGATSTGGYGGATSTPGQLGTGGTPNGGKGTLVYGQGKRWSGSGGYPNGGAVVSGVAQAGSSGYVELTFS